MSNKILMNCIPNRNIILKIQQIHESINNSKQNLKDSYKPQNQGTVLNNNYIHDVRYFIKTSIKIRYKQIRHLKTKLFVF
jgi:hypothetical protein